ncbi:MAG TPA: hypothetical protein VGJ93_06705 [Desulfuromonadaceae bacterium]|jgi:hypothetical protein
MGKLIIMLGLMALVGCSSSGGLGLVMKSTSDPTRYLKGQFSYREMGRAEGESCRYFMAGIFPFGKSDFAAAVDDALSKTGGDALLNVTVSSSLYGFVPIYNIFSSTCTNVQGIAIQFEEKKQ